MAPLARSTNAFPSTGTSVPDGGSKPGDRQRYHELDAFNAYNRSSPEEGTNNPGGDVHRVHNAGEEGNEAASKARVSLGIISGAAHQVGEDDDVGGESDNEAPQNEIHSWARRSAMSFRAPEFFPPSSPPDNQPPSPNDSDLLNDLDDASAMGTGWYEEFGVPPSSFNLNPVLESTMDAILERIFSGQDPLPFMESEGLSRMKEGSGDTRG
ncbi:hypothetical protein L198_08229 [Cryptococcus wingfieldii CBS 7118]|uniref:Uncharacterized protein n=1 Tax=Cryptococcus wingfieldii CBS 7118 TaxID=1295528 RepID=A0A1E3HD74_9TREE|nr:hypothetical protein L198_08229 [Cryptococcus wingfieldii CBS 7118]ODN74298.1 hypothetical protein L198_08229 [Cryptococcus wingfieldii CBS 7118]